MREVRVILFLFTLIVSLFARADVSVGTSKISSDVTNSGASVFCMPINVPDGGGFHPQIDIAYSSQTSGYGNVGYGINIKGISCITSGGKNIFYDGVVNGAKYDGDSSFFLDGKRLLLNSDTSRVEGTEYTIEGDPYTTIILHGSFSTNNLSAWFEVNHRNGTTYSYGKKPTSRIEFNRNDTMCCAAWYITNAKDKYGNEIEYNYTQRNFCVVPNRIIYGTNHNNPRGITCEIDFEYRDIPVENRTKFFISSRQGLISQALSTISTKINGQLF